MTFEELFCSAELTRGTQYQLICLSVLNVVLSITAFLGNTLILVALHRETSLHPPSKLLLRSLATTDLCVGVLVEPLIVTYWMSVVNERWNICGYAFIALLVSGYVLGAASLFTLTAISVDRLLALSLGLRYKQVVTLKRTFATVIFMWIVSIVATTMHFWSYLITLWCSYIIISLCLISSFFSYAKIFLTLRHRQVQVQDHVHQEHPNDIIPLNIARYRKALYFIQCTVVADNAYCLLFAIYFSGGFDQ